MADAPRPPEDTGVADKLKGKAKKVAGVLLDDERMKQEGELHEARSDAVREARDLAEQADDRLTEAELVQRQRDLEEEQQELQATQQARMESARARADEARSESVIDDAAMGQQNQVAQAAQAERMSIMAEEAEIVVERLRAERDASRAEAHADEALRTAERIDEEVNDR